MVGYSKRNRKRTPKYFYEGCVKRADEKEKHQFGSSAIGFWLEEKKRLKVEDIKYNLIMIGLVGAPFALLFLVLFLKTIH